MEKSFESRDFQRKKPQPPAFKSCLPLGAVGILPQGEAAFAFGVKATLRLSHLTDFAGGVGSFGAWGFSVAWAVPPGLSERKWTQSN